MKLLFIHGSGGCREAWQHQTDYFENSEAINLPGHPDGNLISTITGYVEWFRKYLEDRLYDNLVLAGHSLGGAIALQYALDYPDDLAGLVMIGSGARLRVHPEFIAMLEQAADDPDEWNKGMGTAYALINPELAEIIKKRDKENTIAAFINDLKACDRFDVMDRIPSLQVPALAICGDLDLMTPPKYSQFLAENTPNTEAVLVKGGTHFVFAEKPKEVNEAIERFLQKIHNPGSR